MNKSNQRGCRILANKNRDIPNFSKIFVQKAIQQKRQVAWNLYLKSRQRMAYLF